MTEWLLHVKKYQFKNGCSYKDALKGAKHTYKRNITGNGKTDKKISIQELKQKNKQLEQKYNKCNSTLKEPTYVILP